MVLPRVPKVLTGVSVVPVVHVVTAVTGALVYVVVAAGRLAGVHRFAVGHVGVRRKVCRAEGWQ